VGWSSGLELSAVGYNLLGWHFALGAALTLAVAVHAGLRAKPIRRRDLAGRSRPGTRRRGFETLASQGAARSPRGII
jgi:hypothetical protein